MMKGQQFEIGTVVKVIGNEGNVLHWHPVGSIGEVIGHSRDTGNPEVLVGDTSQFVSPEDLEVFEETKVGSEVKIIGNRNPITHGFSIGSTGVVESVYRGVPRVVISGIRQYVSPADLVVLTKGDEKKTNQFEVGDIIRGNAKSDDRYCITNSNMTKGEVIDIISEEEIEVKVLSHSRGDCVGETFIVASKYFEKVPEESLREEVDGIRKGDKVVFVGNRSDYVSIEVGRIYTVEAVDMDDEELPFQIGGLWVYRDEVVPVTSEHVTINRREVIDYLSEISLDEFLDVLGEVFEKAK